MDKNKPTPINRKQFYDTLPEPYQIPEQVLQPYDNVPNPPIYDDPNNPKLIRGNQISLKGDDSIASIAKVEHEDEDEEITEDGAVEGTETEDQTPETE